MPLIIYSLTDSQTRQLFLEPKIFWVPKVRGLLVNFTERGSDNRTLPYILDGPLLSATKFRIPECVWGFIMDRSDIGGAPQLALQLCLIGGPTTSLAIVVAAMRREE